jgi:glutaredoxin
VDLTQLGGGRLTAMKHEVTLLVRAQCHACAAAQADIARICTELDVAWQASDVDADPELRAEYGDRIPVILVDGREHGFWSVEEARLRAALTG